MRSPAWRHLALLTAVAVAFLFAADLLTGAPTRAGGWRGAPLAALQSLPDALYLLLGVVAGISVGTLSPEARNVRQAAGIVAVVTLAMLGLDAWGATLREGGVLRAAIALGSGSLREAHVVLTTYPAGHPRTVAHEALVRAGLLLLPVVLVGLVLGIGAWVNARVIFRAPRDAVVARWVIAWLLVPGATALIVSWSGGYGYETLFRGQPLWLPLVPYVPALALAGVGWRAAARRHDAPEDARGVRHHPA